MYVLLSALAISVVYLTRYRTAAPSKGKLMEQYGVYEVQVPSEEDTYESPDYSKTRSGPGENGAGIFFDAAEKELVDQEMKTWFMSVMASDKIALDRSIRDSRSPACKQLSYDVDLPTASVVIIFKDEAFSVLLR